MPRTKRKCMNKVKLRGTIVRKIRKGNEWLLLAIATSPQIGRRDYPRVFWYGDMIDIVDDAYENGDHVDIEAIITTSKQYRNETTTGVEISNTPTEIEQVFGEYGKGRVLGDENEVDFRGTLVHKFSPQGYEDKFIIGTMRISVEDPRTNLPRTDHPQALFFGKNMEKLRDIELGSEVFVIGHLQTQEEKKDGETIYRQSTICHYLEQA